ncbi:MAG: TIGR00299 family protein [Desulfuromonas sp.]|nr:MAG: TIGR00299 family protein [Desulfuromonas sp.]
MKTLYLDCFSGISGDMFLGMLIDLGLNKDELYTELKKLELDGFELEATREQRHGIEGCRLKVCYEKESHHRYWSQIDRILENSRLDPHPKQLARQLFLRLGKAEAKVHGIELEQVHFHEVGALDAIVDLTGAAIGLSKLNIEQVICAPLPLSRGLSRCAHGALPLPAPATLELLHQFPICDSGCNKELVTPTGAAIVAEVATAGDLPNIRIEKIGYGVGTWELADRPNLLRGLIGQIDTPPPDQDSVQVLETHIDDATPELLGHLLDQLFAQGALDAGYTPLQMKKNRPGVRLTLICSPEQEKSLARLILHQSSAIGIRSYPVRRWKLRRETATIETPDGPAQVKLIYDNDRLLRITPEFDDCRALSALSGRDLQDIYRIVEQAAYAHYSSLPPEQS